MVLIATIFVCPGAAALIAIADADREGELWAQSEVNTQTREQLEIIDLVLNNVSVVGDVASLLVDLGANDVSLVVHLIARVARVILVVAKIDPRVPTVPLKSADHGRAVSAAAGRILRLVKKLIVDLCLDMFVLRNNLIACVA